jgi:hypothetical protein
MAGGRYQGPKTASQRSLSKWSSERWTTATGEKACKGNRCDRYLPEKAWALLTPEQSSATRRKKLSSTNQYVPNTPEARAARKAAR